mgnify:CR=1 FL=1
MQHLLMERGFHCMRVDSWQDAAQVKGKTIGLCTLALEQGFETPEAILLSEQDVLGERIIRMAIDSEIACTVQIDGDQRQPATTTGRDLVTIHDLLDDPTVTVVNGDAKSEHLHVKGIHAASRELLFVEKLGDRDNHPSGIYPNHPKIATMLAEKIKLKQRLISLYLAPWPLLLLVQAPW